MCKKTNIECLQGEDKTLFDSTLAQINSDIGEDQLLDDLLKTYGSLTKKEFENVFSPFDCRIINNALFIRGLFPQ